MEAYADTMEEIRAEMRKDNGTDRLEAYKFLVDTVGLKNTNVEHRTMNKILEICKKYVKDEKLIHVGCHCISNLALMMENAMYLLTQNALVTLSMILKCHEYHSKIIWKAASAIWNLVRPSQIAAFIPDDLANLIFEVLKIHHHDSRVVYTCIGSLSNLAIALEDFCSVFVDHRINLIHVLAQKYGDRSESKIMTHIASLIANVAVDHDIAGKCAESGFVEIFLNKIKDCVENGMLVKHACAALHNMADTPKFLELFVSSEGLEVLNFCERNMMIEGEVAFYIDGIKQLAEIPDSCKHSIHVCAEKDMLSILLHLLEKTDLHVKNQSNETCLDIAIRLENQKMIEFLVAAGSNMKQVCNNKENSETLKSICNGLRTRKYVKNEFNAILKNCTKLNSDVSNIISNFLPGIDLLCLHY